MRGLEVMRAVTEGKKVVCASWGDKEEYYYFDKEKKALCDKFGNITSFNINYLFTREWEIHKEYVTFEEAMKAFKEGATVRAWEDVDDGFYEINEAMSFKEIYEHYPVVGLGNLSLMKWTIEEGEL